MGKRKGGGRAFAKDFKQPRENVWKTPRTEGNTGGPGAEGRAGFDKFDLNNDAFFAYYKARRPPPTPPP